MGDASPNTDKDDPLVGRVVNGRFRIESLIARGGMGRVYKAIQEPLGRVIALKVLDPRYKGEEDPEFQERFFLEASTVAKLSHPNTVTVFDYGKTEDDVFFIAMEYVEGKTLAAILKETPTLDPMRCVHIAVQIGRSLREAHGLGVIHRDLKPANVLITKHADEDDFVKVLDFGLVKEVEQEKEDLTQQGLFMGSPKYMSPEQIRGTNVDGRTDVYSLGVMLYLMLTGHVPFDHQNHVQILMAHCREPVPPMNADGVHVPPALEAVVLKCLAKDAAERYASMNEVIAALKAATALLGGHVMHSGSYPTDMSASGTRAVIEGMTPSGSGQTPSGGVPVAGTPSGGYSVSGALPDVEQKKGSGGKVAVAILFLAAVGGAAFALTQGEEPPPPRTAAAAAAPPSAPAVPAEPEPPPAAEPAEPAPPPEPIRTVRMDIRSIPSGATVRIDNREWITPASVELAGESAAVGRELQFTFSLPGYRDLTVTRTIVDGEQIALNETLAAVQRPRSGGGGGGGGGSSMRESGSSMDEGAEVAPRGSYLSNPY